jgi:hypothetical protein
VLECSLSIVEAQLAIISDRYSIQAGSEEAVQALRNPYASDRRGVRLLCMEASSLRTVECRPLGGFRNAGVLVDSGHVFRIDRHSPSHELNKIPTSLADLI